MDSKLRRKLYLVWWRMKDRCYNPKNKDYKLYGGNGVIVCDEWLNLEDFLNSVVLVDNFNAELILSGELMLDKDMKGNSKIYSRDTCTFINKEISNKYKPHQMRRIVGISPNNEKHIFYNQSEFARRHKLRQSTISDCLNGRVKKHKNWQFYYEE